MSARVELRAPCPARRATMVAARSSGRSSRSDPLTARPMGERAVATMTASGGEAAMPVPRYRRGKSADRVGEVQSLDRRDRSAAAATRRVQRRAPRAGSRRRRDGSRRGRACPRRRGTPARSAPARSTDRRRRPPATAPACARGHPAPVPADELAQRLRERADRAQVRDRCRRRPRCRRRAAAGPRSPGGRRPRPARRDGWRRCVPTRMTAMSGARAELGPGDLGGQVGGAGPGHRRRWTVDAAPAAGPVGRAAGPAGRRRSPRPRRRRRRARSSRRAGPAAAAARAAAPTDARTARPQVRLGVPPPRGRRTRLGGQQRGAARRVPAIRRRVARGHAAEAARSDWRSRSRPPSSPRPVGRSGTPVRATCHLGPRSRGRLPRRPVAGPRCAQLCPAAGRDRGRGRPTWVALTSVPGRCGRLRRGVAAGRARLRRRRAPAGVVLAGQRPPATAAARGGGPRTRRRTGGTGRAEHPVRRGGELRAEQVAEGHGAAAGLDHGDRSARPRAGGSSGGPASAAAAGSAGSCRGRGRCPRPPRRPPRAARDRVVQVAARRAAHRTRWVTSLPPMKITARSRPVSQGLVDLAASRPRLGADHGEAVSRTGRRSRLGQAGGEQGARVSRAGARTP